MATSSGKLCRCCSAPPGEDNRFPYPQKKLLTIAIERFYDNCAAYNLRYIPYRTMTEQTCLQTVAKDFVLLFCFMVSNLVVLLTILSRIAMHMWELG